MAKVEKVGDVLTKMDQGANILIWLSYSQQRFLDILKQLIPDSARERGRGKQTISIAGMTH